MHGKASTLDRVFRWLGPIAGVAALVAGCQTPSPHTMSRNYSLREGLPVDPPRIITPAEDDCAAGGQLFKLYCGSCHNARPLGERPFSNYHVALTHMRTQAYLTGKEYRQIMYFLRRWDNVGPATPPVEPSPKRFVFSQPIPELRGEASRAGSAAAPPPPTGPGPWQPSAASGGREGSSSQPAPGPSAGAAPSQPPATNLPSPLD
jgi:hypothetical protein